MSSKISYYLYFVFSIAFAVFFILLGIFATLLPWLPVVREGLNAFIVDNAIAIFFLGITLIVIGISSISAIIYGSKRQHYSIKAGAHQLTIQDTLFQDYLCSYWKKIFPKYDIPCSVKIKNNKVHITADLPYIPLEKQRNLIEQMQQDVTEMFTRYLGYKAEYRFSVSFLDKAPDEHSHT